MNVLDPSEFDKQIQIKRPVADGGFDGAGSGEWIAVGDPVWASVQDMLPSRGERMAGGINVASRPARVRMYWRDDITPDMRFVMGDRIMEIVAGPAELGFREKLEFVVEDYKPAGNPA